MIKILSFAFMLVLGLQTVAASLTVCNARIVRSFDLSGDHIRTADYSFKAERWRVAHAGSPEFAFVANGRRVSGADTWCAIDVTRPGGSNDLSSVSLSATAKAGDVAIRLTYEAIGDLPLVRKRLAMTNVTTKDVCIEDVAVEDFAMVFSPTESVVLCNYARDKHLGPTVGDWDDCLVMVHDYHRRAGLAIGNEAAGVLKRTAVFEDGRSVRAGLAASKSPHPFRRWLRPGETWEAPAVFTAPYAGKDDPHAALDETIATYVRRHQGARVNRIARKPVFVYNTWHPFRTKLDEKLILSVAKAAAECGVEEFVIDDGWQLRTGDWRVDPKKFPHGLKPVFDEIKALGMKPGLWLSLATAKRDTRVLGRHPDWSVRDAKGNVVSLHDANPSIRTLCMGTDWRDEIRDTILAMVRDFGLAYVKLDLAIATSAYVYDPVRSGCYATNHPYHRDRAESFDAIYARCLELFDELHAAAPELYIDCTFETAGKMHLMDYGLARHADGNWLSNVEEDAPLGSLRVRNLAWRRALALPPASLVIGNLRMDAANHLLGFKSLVGTLPILLGDPRRLKSEERSEYKAWATWLKGVEERHGYMAFRQDLPGFGEPAEGAWDGFARINTETKSGGLVGVFRQNAAETTRQVVVAGLDPAAIYEIRRAPSGDRIGELTGRELAEKGFGVTLPVPCDGEIYELRSARCGLASGTR